MPMHTMSYFFGHGTEFFLNDRKKVSHVGHNVRKGS